ncbi:hypothetical protein BT96DRAFT_434273 [Gymnopus androsaceus JB14]|uniref:F-box domain-containing protein n=1 Tax=Gymnopus androsaceus JB14 TaxID=1447944 RepID=A0A6A4I2T0_9AGAR|nr:hypothetical protein BT96DRAFT_434273 [Gymnopus androsaceus JB14]
MEIILEVRHKIRSLDLRGEYPLVPFFRLPNSSLPLLEDLSLEIVDGWSGGARDVLRYFPHKAQTFSSTPLLRSVTIMDGCRSVALAASLALPFEQMTSLHVDFDGAQFDPAEHYVDILQRCKNLVELVILLPKYDDEDYTGFSSDLLIVLSALESLSILYVDVGVQDLTAILSLFPTIKSFRIENLGLIVNPLLRALTWTKGLRPFPSELTPMVLSRWWSDSERGINGNDADEPCRLQTAVLHDFQFAEDITRISGLPGLIVDFEPSEIRH